MSKSVRHELHPDHAERVEALLGLALSQQAPSGPCPNPEEVAALCEGRLQAARRREVLAHIAGCERCYASWLGTAEMLEAERSLVAVTPQLNSIGVTLRNWISSPKHALFAGSLAAVLVAVLMLSVWAPWLKDLELSQSVEQSYQLLAEWQRQVPITEKFPWNQWGDTQTKGFELWEGNRWDRQNSAARAFAAGVRAGLEQLTPTTPFWRELIAALPMNRPVCAPGDGETACHRLNEALFELGRWAVLVHLACQMNTNGAARSQAPSVEQWQAFWSAQQTLLARFSGELEELPPARAFYEWIAALAQQPIDKPQPLLCERIDELLELGLEGK